MVDALAAVAVTLKSATAFDVIELELSTFAETSKTPPPLSVENGVSENALIPSII